MRTLNTQAGNLCTTVGKVVMAVVCASLIGGIFTAPAFADEYGRREGPQHRRYQERRRVYHPPPPRRYYYNPPPPVVYAPAPYQSPGISIVFPLY